MNKLSTWMLSHRKTIIAIFLSMAVLCALLQLGVDVNHNLSDYLPEDANSTRAIRTMEEEFTQTAPNARVMVSGVTVQQALVFKQQLKQIDGITSVIWLDDVINIKEPLEIADPTTVEAYYKQSNAAISIAIASSQEVRVLREIHALGDNIAIDGQAVTSAIAQEMSASETSRAMVFVIPIVIAALLLSTTSWIQPVLVLVSIGISILLNMGTNLLFGEISFITNSISPILQLAVSLDYAIFLLHSFESYKKEVPDVSEAMRLAVKRSFPAISASAATTIIGFAALVFMRFRIGADLGLILGKSILFSLISVLCFLPALTIMLNKVLEKTQHKSFMPTFNRIGKAVPKLKIPVVALVLLLIVPMFLAQRSNVFDYGMGVTDPKSPQGQEEAAITETFGLSVPLVILAPKGNLASETALSEELKQVPNITSVVSYAAMVGATIPQNFLDEEILQQFYSPNYTRIIAYANTHAEGEKAFAVVEGAAALAQKYYGDTALLCGNSANLYDIKTVVTADSTLVNLIAIGGILLVLLITFKSALLPILLVFTIEASIWINLATPYFLGNSLCYIGFLVINTVQLGATVDYAILFTDHYMDNRKRMAPKQAVWQTCKETYGSILVSGTILASAGFTLMLVSANQIVSQLGNLLGVGTLLSMLMVTVFLPSVLVLFDRAIQKTTMNISFYPRKGSSEDEKSLV